MILGLISIIAGAIIFMVMLLKDTSTEQLQAVQYLGFIWASLFVIGGFIIMAIKTSVKTLSDKFFPVERKQDRPVETSQNTKAFNKSGLAGFTWICKKCSAANQNTRNFCKDCGEYR